MALQKFANVRCIKEAIDMNNTGFILKIDIEKAFDMLPFSVILRTLRKINMSDNLVKYIMNFL